MSRSPQRAWPLLALAVALGCAQPPPPAARPDEVVGGFGTARLAPEVGGVVLPNAGRLQGTLYGPAPGVITRERPESSRIPLDGALELRGAREGQADPGTAPLPGVLIRAFDANGKAVSGGVVTNARGEFVIERLSPSGPLLFLQATATREGCGASFLALAPAPRPVGFVVVNVSPSTTVVARKALQQLRARLLNQLLLPTALTDRVAATYASVMSDRALTAAVCGNELQAAHLFDTLFAGLPNNVQKALQFAADQLDCAALFAVVSSPRQDVLPEPPPPVEPPDPFEGLTTASEPLPPAPPSQTQPAASGTGPATGFPDAPRVIIRTLAQASSGLRVELPPEDLDPDLIAPFEGGAEGARLESLEASVTLRDLERPITAVCYDGNTRYELDGDQLIWDDFTLVIRGTGAVTYADVAVHDGQAYLTGIEPHNVVRVKLDTGEVTVFAGQALQNGGGMRDGQGEVAEFDQPRGIIAAPDALYVADAGNHRIRRITYDGQVTTFAGGDAPGTIDGTGAFARFRRPLDLTRDTAGNLYVADAEAHAIRRVSRTALVKTLTGTTRGTADGAGTAGLLDTPSAVTWGRVAGTEVLVVGQANGSLRLLTGW